MVAVTFTSVALLLFFCSHLFAWERGSAVCIPVLWGVVASFSTAPLLDPTVYERMRRRQGWTVVEFHVGNLVIHILPLVWTPPLSRPIGFSDGVAAAVLHLLWGVAASDAGRVLVLDEVYVPLDPWMWRSCFVVSTITEAVLVPMMHECTKCAPLPEASTG